MENNELIRPDYRPAAKVYEIQAPAIETGNTYFFETDSGLTYEVRFGKKKDNYLGHVVNFSVLSEEFEDEYSETNRGEVFRIIATVIEIIRIYHSNHNFSDSYEFSGEFKDSKDSDAMSIRTKLYYREAQRVLLPNWKIEIEGNKVAIKKTSHH